MSVKPSVKLSVKPSVKQSVKQSVTQNTVNDKEPSTRTPASKHNKKKIILTPMKSPITQIKGGIKNCNHKKENSFFNILQMRKRKWEQK